MTMRGTPRKQGREPSGETGFTLVEILVVMLILALLSSLAIPAFFNQREKASDAGAKESARTAQVAMETYATESNGSYAGATFARLVKLEPTLAGAPVALDLVAADNYTLTATSDSGVTYTIRQLGSGAVERDCAPRGRGGCPVGVGW